MTKKVAEKKDEKVPTDTVVEQYGTTVVVTHLFYTKGSHK